MTDWAAPSGSAAVGVGSSRWAAVAAVVLLALGVAILASGALLISQGIAHDDSDGMGYGWLVGIIGAVVLVIGSIHVIDAIFIRAHRPWARYVGIVIGALGALFGARLLPTAFDPVFVQGPGDSIVQQPPLLGTMALGLMVFPYLLVIVALVMGGRHFRRGLA